MEANEINQVLAMLFLGVVGAVLVFQGKSDMATVAGWIMVFISPSPAIAAVKKYKGIKAGGKKKACCAKK
jgi:hypothetical protein